MYFTGSYTLYSRCLARRWWSQTSIGDAVGGVTEVQLPKTMGGLGIGRRLKTAVRPSRKVLV